MQFTALTRFISRPAGLALAAAALAAVPLAQANDNVYWSVGVVAAPGVSVGVSNARPVYVQPALVYMSPQPVVVYQPPRYVMPAPVYTEPNVYYAPRPVYYGPPQGVYYGPPQVVYGGPRYVGRPVYATGWVPPWHRNRHGHRHEGHRHND
jgi:hypothetical protein